jgi:hypothetical protein
MSRSTDNSTKPAAVIDGTRYYREMQTAARAWGDEWPSIFSGAITSGDQLAFRDHAGTARFVMK